MENCGTGLYSSDESNQHSDDDDGGGFSLRNVVVDELGSDLKKSLKIDNCDSKERNIYYEGQEKEEEEEEEDDGDITEALLVQMGYGKTRPAMFPAEEMEEEEDGDMTEDLLDRVSFGETGPPKHEPPATPIPADNLKSAMKGNGKKEQLPDKEKKVNWAEDVYDPIPSAPSTNRAESHRTENKKSGKNKQKWGGKVAKDKDRGGGKDKEKKRGKGGKEKDKKQVKKFSGSSSSRKCFGTLDED